MTESTRADLVSLWGKELERKERSLAAVGCNLLRNIHGLCACSTCKKEAGKDESRQRREIDGMAWSRNAENVLTLWAPI